MQEQTRVLADTDFEQELARREEAWKRKFNEVRIAAEVEKVRRVEKLERELRMLKMDERMRREMAEQGNDENVPEGVAKGLTPRARQVCAKILEWEGLEGEDFEAAKQRLVQELGARSLVRVKFGSGSAHVGRDDRAALEVAVQGTEEYSLLLAVGFADTGGDEELNRELGTQRAGNVAEVLREMVKQGQFVEPVYLGETERFGERVENRVVEVWELRR